MLATCHLLVYPCSTAGIIHVMLRLVIMHYIQYRRHRIFTCIVSLRFELMTSLSESAESRVELRLFVLGS